MKKIFLATIMLSIIALSCSKNKDVSNIENINVVDASTSQTYNGTQYTEGNSAISIEEAYEREGIDIDKVIIKYYYDGVYSSTPIQDLEDKYPVYSSTKDLPNRSAEISINTFSTLEKYLIYGDDHDYNFRQVEEFRSRVLEYATLHNLLDIEDPSLIPSSYYQFESDLRDEIFGSNKKKRVAVQYYDDFVMGGPSITIAIATSPVLGMWNNRFDGAYGVGLAFVGHGYDKTFYRKHIGTFGGWSLTFYSFAAVGYQQLNNRISSCMQL